MKTLDVHFFLYILNVFIVLQYKTQSAAELNAIFQKRRARADQQGAPLGLPPEFRPLTPTSYDGPDSDSESSVYLSHLGRSEQTEMMCP